MFREPPGDKADALQRLKKSKNHNTALSSSNGTEAHTSAGDTHTPALEVCGTQARASSKAKQPQIASLIENIRHGTASEADVKSLRFWWSERDNGGTSSTAAHPSTYAIKSTERSEEEPTGTATCTNEATPTAAAVPSSAGIANAHDATENDDEEDILQAWRKRRARSWNDPPSSAALLASNSTRAQHFKSEDEIARDAEDLLSAVTPWLDEPDEIAATRSSDAPDKQPHDQQRESLLEEEEAQPHSFSDCSTYAPSCAANASVETNTCSRAAEARTHSAATAEGEKDDVEQNMSALLLEAEQLLKKHHAPENETRTSATAHSDGVCLNGDSEENSEFCGDEHYKRTLNKLPPLEEEDEEEEENHASRDEAQSHTFVLETCTATEGTNNQSSTELWSDSEVATQSSDSNVQTPQILIGAHCGSGAFQFSSAAEHEWSDMPIRHQGNKTDAYESECFTNTDETEAETIHITDATNASLHDNEPHSVQEDGSYRGDLEVNETRGAVSDDNISSLDLAQNGKHRFNEGYTQTRSEEGTEEDNHLNVAPLEEQHGRITQDVQVDVDRTDAFTQTESADDQISHERQEYEADQRGINGEVTANAKDEPSSKEVHPSKLFEWTVDVKPEVLHCQEKNDEDQLELEEEDEVVRWLKGRIESLKKEKYFIDGFLA